MLADFRPLDVLVIAPHPDDAELGMGGRSSNSRTTAFRSACWT